MGLSYAFSLAPDTAVLEKAEEQGAGVSIHLAVKMLPEFLQGKCWPHFSEACGVRSPLHNSGFL